MHQIKSAATDQLANLPRRRHAKQSTRNKMNTNAVLLRSLSERRPVRRHKFRLISAAEQSLQNEKRLILSPTPRCLEINEQRLHCFSPAAPVCSCSINLPSFAYFSRTDRAAICEISA